MKTGKMPIGPKITAEQFTLDELHRAFRELGHVYHYDSLVEAVAQAKKNRIYDEAMKMADSRPDLRES